MTTLLAEEPQKDGSQTGKEDPGDFHAWQPSRHSVLTSATGQGKAAVAWWEGNLENVKSRLRQKQVHHWGRVNCDPGHPG